MYKWLSISRMWNYAILMSEVGSLFFVFSNGFFVCDANKKLGEWDKVPAALSLVEMDMRKRLLLPS